MKSYYSEYVQHCMRFYARYPRPQFRGTVDEQNWKACDSAVKKFPDETREMLLAIYKDRDTIADNVYKMSVARKIKQDVIWELINSLEHQVAKRRGLL